MAAATILFFVFLGFEELANVVEEARNPGRDIPRAIFSGLAITTVLYVLVALAIVGLAPPAELAASDAPLVTALAKVWPGASATLSAIALFATANTVLIALVATSRLAFSMGRDRELPEFFATVLAGRGTPWVGCMLAFVLSIVLLPIGDLTVLAGLSSFSALIAFLAVNATLIAMRYQEPKLHRPFRVPLSVGRLPLLPVAAIASILLLLAFFEWEIYFGGAIGIALTAVAFLLQRWWARKRK
jgi:amino acid transporter